MKNAVNSRPLPKADIPRSQFNRSHGLKTTFDSGRLIPVLVEEALPGDTYNVSMHSFARLATPIAPVMDNLYLDSFFFAVPIRLLWSNWEKFCGEQTDPGDSTSYLIPEIISPAVTGWQQGSVADYMGLPIKAPLMSHSALFHRAYNLIWNEWFRDQNLQDSVPVLTGDGPDPDTTLGYDVTLPRGKRHDYFTSCLPWPQKGDSVQIPLSGEAPVSGIGFNSTSYSTGPVNAFETDGGGSVVYAKYKNTSSSSNYIEVDPNNDGYPNIRADLSEATNATINSLRQAFQIQKLYERDARGGTRYTEILKSHFGVTSPDARMQRPEYLGGTSISVNINPVAQTSSTDATSPQGNLAGFGTASGNHSGFTKSFTEHCIIIGLVSARAELSYQQRKDKMFSRSSRWDFYWPALAQIGEQAVLNKEIFYSGNSVTDNAVFGYQERYAEYRSRPSHVTGLFRSNATGTLDYWHLAQNFLATPTLGEIFIIENPPMARIKSVGNAPDYLFDAYFNIKTARPMPTYGVPGLVDHF